MAGRAAGLVAVCTVALSACAGGRDTAEVAPTQHRTVVVNDDPTPLCVAVAQTVAQKVNALGNRPSIPPKEGMAFPYAEAAARTFTMKETSFPLDIVWVGPGSLVVGSTLMVPLSKDLYRSPAPITLAVELSPQDWGPLAGTARSLSLGQACDGTVTAGRPGQPQTRF